MHARVAFFYGWLLHSAIVSPLPLLGKHAVRSPRAFFATGAAGVSVPFSKKAVFLGSFGVGCSSVGHYSVVTERITSFGTDALATNATHARWPRTTSPRFDPTPAKSRHGMYETGNLRRTPQAGSPFAATIPRSELVRLLANFGSFSTGNSQQFVVRRWKHAVGMTSCGPHCLEL